MSGVSDTPAVWVGWGRMGEMEWEQTLGVLEVLHDEVVDRRNSPASVDASINLPS